MRVLEKKRQEREEVREKGRFEVHLGEMRRGEGTGEEGEGERGGLRGQQYGANRMQEETEIHCERGIVVCVCVYARARVVACVCVCPCACRVCVGVGISEKGSRPRTGSPIE